MGKDEQVTGGNKTKTQIRRAWGGQSFTAARRQVFLDTLAGCANVTRAATEEGAVASLLSGSAGRARRPW